MQRRAKRYVPKMPNKRSRGLPDDSEGRHVSKGGGLSSCAHAQHEDSEWMDRGWSYEVFWEDSKLADSVAPTEDEAKKCTLTLLSVLTEGL